MTLTSTDGGNLVATITVNSVTIHTGPGGQYNESPTKGEYAVADVTVTVDSGSYDYSEDDFAFQEPDGTTYSMDDGNGSDSGYDPSLDFRTLPAGGSKRGRCRVRRVEGAWRPDHAWWTVSPGRNWATGRSP